METILKWSKVKLDWFWDKKCLLDFKQLLLGSPTLTSKGTSIRAEPQKWNMTYFPKGAAQSSALVLSKDQLILEGNFGVIKSPKKRTKFFEGFLP